jgi:hypothetical protein
MDRFTARRRTDYLRQCLINPDLNRAIHEQIGRDIWTLPLVESEPHGAHTVADAVVAMQYWLQKTSAKKTKYSTEDVEIEEEKKR